MKLLVQFALLNLNVLLCSTFKRYINCFVAFCSCPVVVFLFADIIQDHFTGDLTIAPVYQEV